MIKAIVTQLKTGTIKTVIRRGSNTVNPPAPYVKVWGPELIPQPGHDNQGQNQYFIACHFNRGYGDDLDDYITNEVVDLLNKQVLTTRDFRKVQLHVSGGPSNMIEGHDDKTISKERIFTTAAIYD